MVAFFLFRVMIPLAQISTWRRKWMWRRDAWGWMIIMVIWEREEEEGEGIPIVHLFPKRQHLWMLGPTMTRWRLAVTWKSFVSCVFLTSWLHFVFSYCSLFPLVVLLVFFVFLISPPPHHSNWSATGCRCDRPCLWPIRIGALGRRVLALCTHHPLSTSPIPSSTTLSPLDK